MDPRKYRMIHHINQQLRFWSLYHSYHKTPGKTLIARKYKKGEDITIEQSNKLVSRRAV